MMFAGPIGAVLGAFAVFGAALVALYLLKLRRRRVEVPFAALWLQLLSDRHSTALWRKLRRWFSLALQLLLLALMLLAVADPHWTGLGQGRDVVLLVDTSASMQTRENGGETRLQAALGQASQFVDALGENDQVVIVRADARPAPLGPFTRDERALRRALDGVRGTDAPADFRRAFAMARDLLAKKAHPTIVLFSDGGGVEKALVEVPLPGIDLRYAPIGQARDNLGIVSFAARRYRANQTAYEVLAQLRNFGGQRQTVRVELLQEGQLVEVHRAELGPNETWVHVYPHLAGEGPRLELRLRNEEGREPDAFATDNHAYAVLPARSKTKVLLVSAGDLFLEGALLLDQNLQVERIDAAKYRAADTARFDAVILDRVTPREPPQAHALYLDPRGAEGPFAVASRRKAPLFSEVAAEHPLTRWLKLRDLNVAESSVFRLGPGDVAVAGGYREPMIVAREREGRRTVAVGFAVHKSDLPLRVAFPVLLINVLEWFSGQDSGLHSSLPTGQSAVLAAGAETMLRQPDGSVVSLAVQEGRARFVPLQVGHYTLLLPTVELHLAAQLGSEEESRIAPLASLQVAGSRAKAPPIARVKLRISAWMILLFVALMLLAVEWWTFHRRVTV